MQNPWYPTPKFFLAYGAVTALIAAGFWWPPAFDLGRMALPILVLAILWEGVQLGRHASVAVQRRLPTLLSLGEPNPVNLEMRFKGRRALHGEVVEELPVRLHRSGFRQWVHFAPGQALTLPYQVHPLERGVYTFGRSMVYFLGPLGLLQRRVIAQPPSETKAYPSVAQMKRFELALQSRRAYIAGSRTVPRLGSSFEFEQIKTYAPGDDYRSLNWKATARRHQPMVNLYQDERSQAVYNILDCGRAMQRPFDGMRLMDYAVNAALVMSRIAMMKHDHAGLVAYRRDVDTFLPARQGSAQLGKLLESLYQLEASSDEADLAQVHRQLSRGVRRRALLLWHTDLPYSRARLDEIADVWRRLGQRHALVVCCFVDTELLALQRQEPADQEAFYQKLAADEQLRQKRHSVEHLRSRGISTVFTAPENLTAHSINAYLHIKARRSL
jgi:uncharacterized protein (DUF58 family)